MWKLRNLHIQVIELLSIRAPTPETKLKLLKEIAEEHELDWDPAATETEFFKSHEDLLVSKSITNYNLACFCNFSNFVVLCLCFEEWSYDVY